MTQALEITVEQNAPHLELVAALGDGPEIDQRQEFLASVSMGCRDCEPVRSRRAANIATFVGERINPVKAIALVDERAPCDHVEIEITDELEVSSAKDAWRFGRAVLARARLDSEEWPVADRAPNLPESATARGRLRLSEAEAQVALVGLAFKSGEVDGQPVAGGRRTPRGFVSNLSIKNYESLTDQIIGKLADARKLKGETLQPSQT